MMLFEAVKGGASDVHIQCFDLKVDRGITSDDVLETLAELFAMRGVPRRAELDPDLASDAILEGRFILPWSSNDLANGGFDKLCPNAVLVHAKSKCLIVEKMGLELKDVPVAVNVFENYFGLTQWTTTLRSTISRNGIEETLLRHI
jgi:hypothetical protein